MGINIVHSIEWVLTIVILVMAIFAPKEYSFSYCCFAFILSLIGIIIFFSFWKKANCNFFDFSPIFIIVATIMGFLFPLAIYHENPSTAYYFSWGLPYSLDYINKGACISGLGILSFMAGSTCKSKKLKRDRGKKLIKTNQLTYLIWFVLIISFIGLGGFSRYQKIYQNIDAQSNPILTYLEVFIIAISQVILINECWNISQIRKYKVNRKSIFIIVMVALTFMYVGNRTICLYLLLPLIIFITSRYFQITLKNFLILALLGGGLMVGAMIFRSGNGINSDLDWYYYLVDLMNPNTTTYLSCEIVDKTGFTFGESMLGSILGIIPFGQSILQSLSGMTPEVTNSATIFTKFLGVQVAGTGTNFISDSYLAFGCFGVIVFSYFPGKIINYLKVNQDHSYYVFLIYMIVCGFAVYAVRASFIYIIRFIFYGIIFAYINLKISRLGHSKMLNTREKI